LVDCSDVERACAIRPPEFFSRHYHTNTPVLIPGFASGWPALGKWSPRHFADRYGDVAVQVAADLGAPAAQKGGPYRRWVTQPMRAFVELVERAADASVYLVAQSHALQDPAMEGLWDDLRLDPELFDDSARTDAVSLWMGPRQTVTPLHRDQKSSFLVQIHGRKRVMLVSPLYTAKLYNEHGGYSNVDPEKPDIARWPLFAGVPVQTALLEPGDALFLPIHWWHHVRSLSPSISLSIGNFRIGHSAGLPLRPLLSPA
jgi:hypothetical protein